MSTWQSLRGGVLELRAAGVTLRVEPRPMPTGLRWAPSASVAGPGDAGAMATGATQETPAAAQREAIRQALATAARLGAANDVAQALVVA